MAQIYFNLLIFTKQSRWETTLPFHFCAICIMKNFCLISTLTPRNDRAKTLFFKHSLVIICSNPDCIFPVIVLSVSLLELPQPGRSRGWEKSDSKTTVGQTGFDLLCEAFKMQTDRQCF